MAQRLDVFQSLWAMDVRTLSGPQRGVEEACAMVAEAGYDGVGIDLYAVPVEVARTLRPVLDRLGLGCVVTGFPKGDAELKALLELAGGLEARALFIIGQSFPLSPLGMIPMLRRWLEWAAEAGIDLQLETHRAGLLNDLLPTLQLLDELPELRVSGDLSHVLLDREFTLPLGPVERGWMSRLLARCASLQGRVASRQQIQLPATLPRYPAYRRLFEGWWAEGIAGWRQRSSRDERFVFLMEIGPPEYAITDAAGAELSDRAAEALELRAAVRAIWAAAEPAPEQPGGAAA